MNELLKRGCAALLCALLAGTPALAETDGFFSEAGMFEYLSAPTALPLKADEVAPRDVYKRQAPRSPLRTTSR